MQQETRAADVRVNRMQLLIDSRNMWLRWHMFPGRNGKMYMNYVRDLKSAYELDKALETGTIFPELDKPFLAVGRGCRRC